MRIVVLAPSVYSETACATAVRLCELGYVPVGAMSLHTLDHRTLLRKIGQRGLRDVVGYARTKIFPGKHSPAAVHNPHLVPFLTRGTRQFRNLREVATAHNFPVAFCSNQNSPESVAQIRTWSPDLILFTGGNILRSEMLQIPRHGVINVHLGLLPEVRGMSTPEWSLLTSVPLGVTIHYMDAGIDTGPILRRCELPDTESGDSLADLRNRLIAFGIEQLAEVVTSLDRGTISPNIQSDLDQDNQFFVIHERLERLAAERLKAGRPDAAAVRGHG